MDGEMAFCSGHGVCDACRQRCDCYEGFGGALKNGTIEPPRDVAPDCSKRTCCEWVNE